jgi:predicted ATPase
MAKERALLSQLHDVASLIQLHTLLGIAETLRGNHAQAEEHQRQVLYLYDPESHQSSVFKFRTDPAISVLAISSWRLWLTGWSDQAVEHVMRAQERAETTAHLLALMNTLIAAARIRISRGEFPAAMALVQRLVGLGRAHGFVHFEAMGTMFQGSVWVQEGELDRGLALLTTGLAQYRRLDSQASLPFFLTFLAEAHLRLGQVEEGLFVIGEAVQLTETHFVRFWAPEVYRVKGELLLAQAGPTRPHTYPEATAAGACLQQALAIARQQRAKALELRAAMSLSRLWLDQDQPKVAQELLAESYGWFTEGLDTADLQAAQDLLARCHPVV